MKTILEMFRMDEFDLVIWLNQHKSDFLFVALCLGPAMWGIHNMIIGVPEPVLWVEIRSGLLQWLK